MKKRKYTPKHLKRRSKKIPITILVLVILGALGVGPYLYYNSLKEGIKSEKTEKFIPETDRPKYSGNGKGFNGKNFILVGSDSESSGVDSEKVENSRSDTTVVIHFSKDGKRTDLVSIPRDSMVEIPKCRLESGEWTSPSSQDVFNSAFTRGDSMRSSVSCTMRTIEKNTKIHLSGFIVVDFTGFKDIVDSLGGITVDVPEKMVSKKAHLNLEPGKQTLNGKKALAYSRARTFEVGAGDGSDLGRIKRQQQVMQAVASKASKVNPLSNPIKFNSTAKDFLKALTVSEELNSLDKIYPFAKRLQSGQKDMNFATVPTVPYPQDPNRVVWSPRAKLYWNALKNDSKLPSSVS